MCLFTFFFSEKSWSQNGHLCLTPRWTFDTCFFNSLGNAKASGHCWHLLALSSWADLMCWHKEPWDAKLLAHWLHGKGSARSCTSDSCLLSWAGKSNDIWHTWQRCGLFSKLFWGFSDAAAAATPFDNFKTLVRPLLGCRGVSSSEEDEEYKSL